MADSTPVKAKELPRTPERQGDAPKPADHQEGALAAMQQISDLSNQRNSNLLRPPAQPLSQEGTAAAVTALDKATTGTQVLAVIGGKSEGDRGTILESYKQAHGGHDLLSDLSKKGIEGEDYAKVVAALRRKDGVTDTEGVIDRNLGAIKDSQRLGPDTPEQGRQERNIRDSLSTLNTAELNQLDARLRQTHGGQGLGQVLLADKTLSEGTRRAIELQLYGDHRDGMPTDGRELKGSDYRAAHPEVALAMADNALKAKDLPMFQEAMRNAPPAAREQFAKGIAGQTGDQQMQAAFKGDDLTRAREFAANGGISLQSLISANDRQFLLWKAQGGIDVAMKNARPEDAQSFHNGMLLDGRTDTSKPLTTDEQRDLSFYRGIHERLKAANDDPRQVAAWEDTLANRGSFISTLAAGQTANDRFKAVENMPEAQRQRLRDDPGLRTQLDRSIDAITGGDEAKRLHDLVGRKLDAGSAAEAALVGRTVDATMKDNAPPNYRSGDVLAAIASMGGSEAQQYKDNPQFRKDFDERVHRYLSQAEQREKLPGLTQNLDNHDHEVALADRMLGAIAKGQPPLQDKLTQAMMMAAQAVDGSSTRDSNGNIHSPHPEDARGIGRKLDEALREDPQLAARVKADPNSPEARDMSWALRVAAGAAQPPLQNFEYGPMVNRMLREGHLNLDDKVRLGQSNEDRYRTIVNGSTPEERAMLTQQNPQAEAKRLQQAVLGGFSKDVQEVLRHGLEEGNLTPADKVRLAVLDGNVTEKNLSTILRGQDLGAVKSQFAERYHVDMDSSVLKNVKEPDRQPIQDVLSSAQPTPGDQINSRNEASVSKQGGMFFGSQGDTANIEAARNNMTRLATQMAAGEREQNNPQLQQQIAAMDTAISQYTHDANRTREMADQAIQTTIQAAVLASAALTDGVALPVALTVAGGVFHAGLSGETDPWGVTKELIKGTVNAGLMAIPGSQIGAMMRITGTAAEATAARFAGNALLREGSQAELQAGLTGLAGDAAKGNGVIAPAKFQDLAQSLARPDAKPSEVADLAKQLASQFNTALTAGAADYFTTSVRAYEAAKLGSGAGVTSGTVSGALDWDSEKSVAENLSRVASNAAGGTLEGAGMAVGFGEAAHGLRALFHRSAAGALTVKADGGRPDSDKLEVVHTNDDGTQTVRAVPRDGELTVDPKDKVRLAANDNGAPPQGAPRPPALPGATARPMAAANDNFRPAANDNQPVVAEPARMVVNGSPTVMAGNEGNGDRPKLTVVPGGRTEETMTGRGNDDKGGEPLKKVPETGGTPAELKPELQEVAAKLRPDQQQALRDLQGDKKYEKQLDWLRQNADKTDPQAYMDILMMHHNADVRRSQGKSALDIPIDKLQQATPEALRFTRDRFRDVQSNFERPTSPQTGVQYEYAAQKYLMREFGDNASPGGFRVPDTDRGNGHMLTVKDKGDWVFVPGSANSIMDHTHTDGMFINIKDGTMVPVDIKENEAASRRGKSTDNYWNLTFDKGSNRRPIDASTGEFRTPPTAAESQPELARLLAQQRSASTSIPLSAFGRGGVDFPSAVATSPAEIAAGLRTFVAQAARSDNPVLNRFGQRAEGPRNYWQIEAAKPGGRPDAGLTGLPAAARTTPETMADRLRTAGESVPKGDDGQFEVISRSFKKAKVDVTDAEAMEVYRATRGIADDTARIKAVQDLASEVGTYRTKVDPAASVADVVRAEAIRGAYRDLGVADSGTPSREDAYLTMDASKPVDQQVTPEIKAEAREALRLEVAGWFAKQTQAVKDTVNGSLEKVFNNQPTTNEERKRAAAVIARVLASRENGSPNDYLVRASDIVGRIADSYRTGN